MGSTQRETKLVLLEDGARLSCLVQKEIVRVKHLVAKELENCPVQSIAAGFCNHADVGTTIAPIACIVESCLDFELLYAIGVRNRNAATPCSTALHIAHAYSVDLEVVVIGTRSVHVNPIV